ncbi:MAG: hypothetical protein QOE90_3246 [Thermoplasmata archaeon]|nr:hypothetical protein [Thermoplasmata archaeon]
MPNARRWRYVDEGRTHQVDAWTDVDNEGTSRYVVQESQFGSTDRADAYVERHTLKAPWETTMHQADLETRLALLGAYQAQDTARGAGWFRLRPPLAAMSKNLDLDAMRVPGGSETVEFHHYQRMDGARAVTLLGVAQDLAAGRRYLLGRLDYRYPDVDGGNLRVVHARLPQPVYRSLLAQQHLELHELEFRKTGEGIRADSQSWAALRACLDAILSRLLAGSAGDKSRPVRLPDELTLALRASAGASKAPRQFGVEDEGLGPSSAVKAKAMGKFDELDPDILGALKNPKLLALHARWLAPGEDAKLQQEGELAIRERIVKLRAGVAPDQQHIVSLLEASLLVRAALFHHGRIDSETLRRVKTAGAWLGT